jgi:hypothetical protein
VIRAKRVSDFYSELLGHHARRIWGLVSCNRACLPTG